MTDLNLNGVALSTAVPDALVLKVARQLAGARRNVFVDVPGRSGSWVFPEQPGDRTLVATLDVSSASFADRRAAIRALAYWADVGAVARLIVDDEPDRYHEAILDASTDPAEWLTYVEQLELPFRVGPYALAIALSVETLAVSGGSPESSTFVAPDTVEGVPVVEITPTDGTMTELTWTLNGNALTFGETLLSGETVTISSLSDTVTLGVSGDVDLTGAFVPAAVAMGAVSGDFGRIIEGVNAWSLQWTGTATTATVTVTWRERFR